jgi:hypothetical protein
MLDTSFQQMQSEIASPKSSVVAGSDCARRCRLIEPGLPDGLIAAAAALTAWLEDADAPGMIVGGVAASLLGRPRMTQDVDALAALPEDRWPMLLAKATAHGLAARIEDPLAFAARTRVLLMRHEPSGIDIDLILGGLRFELDAIAAATPHRFGHLTIRLPRVEDLMIMKAIARRPRDMLDLEALMDRHPQADLDHVRSFLQEFAHAASMSDLLTNWDRFVARRDPGAQDSGHRPTRGP